MLSTICFLLLPDAKIRIYWEQKDKGSENRRQERMREQYLGGGIRLEVMSSKEEGGFCFVF